MQFVSNTTLTALKKLTCSGSAATSCFITSVTPKRWESLKYEEFLTHLAVEGNVTAATQNQALNSLVFLYRHVLQLELDARVNAIRAKRPQRLPVVLSSEESLAIIRQTTGVFRIMLQLLYGSGLRLRECMQLRVKDIDFAQLQLIIRSGKGDKDRVTLLPQAIISPLQIHLQQVQQIHQQDLSLGYGATLLPFAFDRKDPNAARQWVWQYVFPASVRSQDPRSDNIIRHHMYESSSLPDRLTQKYLRKSRSTPATPPQTHQFLPWYCRNRG